jgi:hypothetical protein
MPTLVTSRTSFWFGSLMLCKLAEPDERSGYTKEFGGLLAKLKDHLETFPNVKVKSFDDEKQDFSVRLARIWAPGGKSVHLDPGPWIFPEFVSPIVFSLHLPAKIQNKYHPVEIEGEAIEDFTIAYDGMTFTVGVEHDSEQIPFWTPPAIREYLWEELFEGFEDCSIANVPPTPLHVTLRRVSRSPGGEAKESEPTVSYDERVSCILLKSWESRVVPISTLTEYIHRTVQCPLHEFYHLMIDKDSVDNLYGAIRGTSQDIFDSYFELLDTPWWLLPVRSSLKKKLSISLVELQREFCDHSIALAEFHESRERLRNLLTQYPPLGVADKYFWQMGKTDEVNYDVFHATLEHIRSHLLVVAQNGYLLLAAVVGALLTLLATYLPKILNLIHGIKL